jgi:hypothetical protein
MQLISFQFQGLVPFHQILGPVVAEFAILHDDSNQYIVNFGRSYQVVFCDQIIGVAKPYIELKRKAH